jgi:hypothetical protein
MQFVSAGVVGLCLLASAGCGSLDSSQNTIGPMGPAAAPSAINQVSLFTTAYEKAAQIQQETYQTATQPPLASKHYQLLAQAGFGLVKSNCANFFRTRGESQMWLRVGADAVGIAGGLATGVTALAGGSTLAVAIIALSSTTLYSGIDSYSRNFLFGADNIDSVRSLTMSALEENATNAFGLPDDQWTFQYAVTAITTNQDICKPASILDLTRQAIRGGKVESVGRVGASDTDVILRKLIASRMALPAGSSMSDDQLAVVCGLASYSGATFADPAAARKKVPIDPFRLGPASNGWNAISSLVAEDCRGLSAATRLRIDQTIRAVSVVDSSDTKPPTGGQSQGGATAPIVAPAK